MQILRRYIFLILLLLVAGVSYSQVPDSIINNIQASPEADTSKALVVIGDVAVRGYKKTKLYIIQREIPFKNGDYILRSELNKKIQLCHDQLMNTSLFVDVEVTIARQDSELVFIDIKVKERWYLFPLPYFKIVDRNFNQWWVEHKRSLNRVNYGLKFMQNNVSGRNDNLNIWIITGYNQQLSFRYENPFLDKTLKHGMNLGVSYSRSHELNAFTYLNKDSALKDEDRYLTSQFHVDASYSYRPAIKTRHIFRVSYTNQWVHDTVIAVNPKYFTGGANQVKFVDLSYTLQYFDVDYISYPLKGFMGDAYIYKRFGAKNNLWSIGGKGTYTVKIFPKSYLQFQASGAIKAPFKQPYFTQRLLGTSDLLLRGLEYYVIDGDAGGVARATAKREVLSFSIRNRLAPSKTHDKIPFRVFLKGYGDVGYAYNPDPGNSMFNNKWLRTWGAGIDVLTFYDIVMKFEYSFNQLGEGGLFIHTKADF